MGFLPVARRRAADGRPRSHSPADKPAEGLRTEHSAVVCSPWCVPLAIYVDTLKFDAGISAPWMDGRKASDNQEVPTRRPVHCRDDSAKRYFDVGVPWLSRREPSVRLFSHGRRYHRRLSSRQAESKVNQHLPYSCSNSALTQCL